MMQFRQGAPAHDAGGEHAPPCVPIIRLRTQHFTVNRGDALRPHYEDVELPVIALAFDYGGRVVDADAPELWLEHDRVLRDHACERGARLALESFGAVDLDCLDSHGRDLDARADYLVSLDEDESAYCAFTACALPELVRRGYRVELDPAYPYRLIQGELTWYAEGARDGERPDWFGLELGVEIDGQRVNLVPVLLSLLERSAELSSLRALERGTEKLLVVPVASFGYARVSPDWLKRVWTVLVALYKEGTPSGSEARELARGRALKALDQAFMQAGTQLHWSKPGPGSFDPEQELARAFLAPPEAIDPARIPVRASLRPYQLEGVAFLQHLRQHRQGGVLADDMGLGKTLQTIAHLALEHTGNALAPPSLIVCPTSLVYNWQRELARFAPQLRVRIYHGQARHAQRAWLDAADVIVTSYPILLRDTDVLEPLSYHLLVLDEAQAIKNSDSAVHRAVCGLRAEHRLCLSGTPIENRLSELWSLFDFLSPGMLGSHSQFRAHFPGQLSKSLADQARLSALSQRVGPFILRRMKESVAKELPAKIVSVVPIELSGKQRELYESIRAAAHREVRSAIRHKGPAGATLDVLDALLKLRQLCCDPRLLSLPAARFVRESAKLERLMQLLEAHLECGRRVLVFSQFTGMLSLIAEALDARGIAHLSLTGATQNRGARVDAFTQGRADVFLISLKAGGTGLNLVSADTVIHYDPWWNPAAQDQATDRAYRIGQDKPVLVQELLTVGSVEERMRVLCEQKRALAQAILHGDRPTSNLSEAIVDDLLAPLTD